MPFLGPWVLMDGEFKRGVLAVEDGIPVEFRKGEGGKVAVPGAVVPALANAHTHVGDAFITDPPDGTLRELVAPPDGYKHRRLTEASEEEVEAGMRRALLIAVASGTTRIADFREGGLPGARLLLRSCLGLPVRPAILGRPSEGTGGPREIRSLLQVVDGFGASGIGDTDYSVLESWSEEARRAGKAFAIHASEGEREDIDRILDLRPTALVHMASATRGDLEMCADAEVPVVVCPRSNARFGLTPDIPAMLDLGLTVNLGTDNAMFNPPSILEEMRFVHRMRWGGKRLAPEDILHMAIPLRKGLRGEARLGVEIGQPSDLAVLHVPDGGPNIKDLVAAPQTVIRAVVHDGVLWEVRGREVAALENLES